MVSTEEPVSKTDLVGKTTIKAQLGEEIKKLSIHNDDLTYDELIIMLQRLFKKFITKDDELTLKYKDEDGDLITLNDNLDLNTALEAGSILKITVFVNGKEFCLETSEVKKIRHELQGIRDRINYLLDSLEYKKDEENHDDIKGKLASLGIKDKIGGAVLNGPSTVEKKQLTGGPSTNVLNATTTSKEFDPYALLRKDRPREEVEGRTEESEAFLGAGASRAPPSGSSVINNLLSRPGPQNAVPNGAPDASGGPKMPELDHHRQSPNPMWTGPQPHMPPPKPAESTSNSNKGAPPQILPTVQHTHLPAPFNPGMPGPVSQPQSFGQGPFSHQSYQAPPQCSFPVASRQSPGPSSGLGLPPNNQPPPPSSMAGGGGGALKQMMPPQAGPRPMMGGPAGSINQLPMMPQGGPGAFNPSSTASYPPQQAPLTSMMGPPGGPPKYMNEPPTFQPGPPSSSSSMMMMGAPPPQSSQGQMSQPQQQFSGGYNPTVTSNAMQHHQNHHQQQQYQQQQQQQGPPPPSAANPQQQQQFYPPGPMAPPSSNAGAGNPYARMPGPPPGGNSAYYQQTTSMAGPPPSH